MRPHALLTLAGISFLIIFSVQGQYMAFFMGGLQDMPDGQRMLLRSAHIYAMLCALPTIVLGLYLPRGRALRWYEWIATAMFLVAPIIMLIGFFTESNQVDTLERPMIRVTLILMFFAIAALPLVHAMAERKRELPEQS